MTVAILDVGRARLKVSRWACGSSIERLAFDVTEVGRDEEKESLPQAVRSELQRLSDLGDRVVVTGGSRLRDDAELSARLAESAAEFGALFRALDPVAEGEALAASYGLGDDELLIDVGGGSVQAIWLEGGRPMVASFPLGT